MRTTFMVEAIPASARPLSEVVFHSLRVPFFVHWMPCRQLCALVESSVGLSILRSPAT